MDEVDWIIFKGGRINENLGSTKFSVKQKEELFNILSQYEYIV